MDRPTPEVLFSRSQIDARILSLASEISAAHATKWGESGVVMVGPLKGAVVFMADLSRALSDQGLRVDLSFIRLSSYGAGTVSSGQVVLGDDVDMDVVGRDVILVDDIIDTGGTLAFAQEYLAERRPRSVITVAFLDKPARREIEVKVDHVGFEIPDLFVIGYGTDLDQRYRELPYIGVFR